MSYIKSDIDNDNIEWFKKCKNYATLKSIKLCEGNVLGLGEFEVKFNYPISAFAGSNGSGKSTMLAIAALAFRSVFDGHTFPLNRGHRHLHYFPFSGRLGDESPTNDAEIRYEILHHSFKEKTGLEYQSRRIGLGFADKYEPEVDRNVIYFDTRRTVAHSERIIDQDYTSKFGPDFSKDDKKDITEIAREILDKNYMDFDNYLDQEVSIPSVRVDDVTYSGFNMGSGEVAVFEILTALYFLKNKILEEKEEKKGKGALVIIDEIELGLHERAQIKMIDKLKDLCNKWKYQIICSTHSYAVLSNLPPEARFFIEKHRTSTVVTDGISAHFACASMGKPDARKLNIFVEDKAARLVLMDALEFNIRRHCNIIPIGSSVAVLRQLASKLFEGVDNCMAVLDGDKKFTQNKDKGKVTWEEEWEKVVKQTELGTRKGEDPYAWGENRISFLPGNTGPEKWLLDEAVDILSDDRAREERKKMLFDLNLGNDDELLNLLSDAARTENKNFFNLGTELGIDGERVQGALCKLVRKRKPGIFSELIKKVNDVLSKTIAEG